MNATPSTFSASWSRSLKVSTVLIFAMLIVINALYFYDSKLLEHFRFGLSYPLPLNVLLPAGVLNLSLCLLTVIACALFSIRGYELTPDELLVPRLLWTTRIPLTGLTDVVTGPNAVKDPDEEDHSFRLWGIGGLFCYCGYYWSRRFKTYSVFATNFENTVVLTIKGKTVLVTPDDPERFVKAIKGE